MVIKRGVKGNYILVLMLFTVLFLATATVAETGKECSVSPTLAHCGGASIYTKGYGAVELCEVCYKCGLDDGVCPESYSDGVLETDSLKKTISMRVGRVGFYGDSYTVAFKTGNVACTSIAGDCDYVQRSLDGNSWSTISDSCGVDVSTSSSYNNAYFRAICKNVPRKAGCEQCPDPDCTNTLSGWAVDTSDNNKNIANVVVKVRSSNNPQLNVLPDGASDSLGKYTMNAVSGEVNITCEKNGYDLYSKKVYLNADKNIFDCKMVRSAVSCEPACYLMDAYGDARCESTCDGVNGCDMSDDAKSMCSGKILGSVITLKDEMFTSPINGCIYENITTLTCCTGSVSSAILGTYGIGGCGNCFGSDCTPITEGGTIIGLSNVSSVVTRSYRKEINGLPVTLKIIVYNKDYKKK